MRWSMPISHPIQSQAEPEPRDAMIQQRVRSRATGLILYRKKAWVLLGWVTKCEDLVVGMCEWQD